MTLGTGEGLKMKNEIVEEQVIDIAETSISLEEEANERKRRLKEMRERMQQERKFSAFYTVEDVQCEDNFLL